MANLTEHLLSFKRHTDAVAAAEEGIDLLTAHHARHPTAHQALMNELTATLGRTRAAEADRTAALPDPHAS